MKRSHYHLRRGCATLVGIVFFVAGVLKLMDPVGAGLVVDEYFKFFHTGFLAFAAKPVAVGLALLESLLGAALITGSYRKLTAWITWILTAVFTVVTLILWLANPAMDCGCFGEAIHLTHFQTFAKNVVLLLLECVAFIPLRRLGRHRKYRVASFWLIAASLVGLTVYTWMYIPPVDFTPFDLSSRLYESVKDEEELELMREASRINDRAMGEFKKLIRAGVTEKQIADQMHGIYISLGAEDYSFQPIVAFGANAAVGHHLPDDTVLKEGDCVLFDVGCKYHGYCSDMTRTFFYGSVDEESRKVYETVLKAQVSAEEAVRTGMVLCELDTLARNVISDAGYGPYFTHRLGHFIGTETHEKGDVSQSSRIVSAPGMTFSIEPGIYVPGKVGVRIEDLVIVTEHGAELLNHYPKELQVVPAE